MELCEPFRAKNIQKKTVFWIKIFQNDKKMVCFLFSIEFSDRAYFYYVLESIYALQDLVRLSNR